MTTTERLTGGEILNLIEGKGSPVGQLMRDHPWEKRTGRLYFTDQGGDLFPLSMKIEVNGLVFIKYRLALQYYEDGGLKTGVYFSCWEWVPEPKAPNTVKRRF